MEWVFFIHYGRHSMDHFNLETHVSQVLKTLLIYYFIKCLSSLFPPSSFPLDSLFLAPESSGPVLEYFYCFYTVLLLLSCFLSPFQFALLLRGICLTLPPNSFITFSFLLLYFLVLWNILLQVRIVFFIF